MVVLIVGYDCKPGQREAFVEAVKSAGLDQMSRDEEGNLRYAYSYAVEDPDKVYLLEQWKSEEAFNEHCATEHFKKLGEMKGDYVLNTVFEKYYTED